MNALSPSPLTHAHGLWSLWDIMQRFRVSSYGVGINALTRTATSITAADMFGAAKDAEADRMITREGLSEAEKAFMEVPHVDGSSITVRPNKKISGSR